MRAAHGDETAFGERGGYLTQRQVGPLHPRKSRAAPGVALPTAGCGFLGIACGFELGDKARFLIFGEASGRFGASSPATGRLCTGHCRW